MIFEWRGNGNYNFFLKKVPSYAVNVIQYPALFFMFTVTAPKTLSVEELDFLMQKPSVVRRIAKLSIGIKNFKKKIKN